MSRPEAGKQGTAWAALTVAVAIFAAAFAGYVLHIGYGLDLGVTAAVCLMIVLVAAYLAGTRFKIF